MEPGDDDGGDDDDDAEKCSSYTVFSPLLQKCSYDDGVPHYHVCSLA
jgi:hypothetical protein